MMRVLALLSSALLGAVVATGLATRSLSVDARPAPPMRAPTPTELSIRPEIDYFTAREVAQGSRAEGEVIAGGDVIVRIRTSVGASGDCHLDPYERALLMAHRLNGLLAAGASGEDIHVQTGDTVQIVGRGRVLVVVDPHTAKLNGSSPQALALRWRGSLADALDSLARPKPTIRGDQALLPNVALCSLQSDDYAPEPHFRAREDRPAGQEVGEVVVGDVTVFRITSYRLELSPYERAIIAAKRINDFVADYGLDGPLRLQERAEAGEVDIMGGEILLVTADPETARNLGLRVGDMSRRWLDALRGVLNAPPAGSAMPFEGEPALAGADGDAEPTPPASDDQPPAEPEPEVSAADPGLPLVHADSGARLGWAMVVGPQADRCTAVVVAEGAYDRAARVLALVPLADPADRGEARLDCGVSAFRLATPETAAAWPRRPQPPPTLLTSPASIRTVQGGFGLLEMLRVAGIDEGVRWFGPELDRYSNSVARRVAPPPAHTAVVPARDSESGSDFAAAQFVLASKDSLVPARALVKRDAAMGSLSVKAVSEDGGDLGPEYWLGAWIELPVGARSVPSA